MIKVLILTMILVSSGYLGLSISNVYKTKLNFFKELSSFTKNIKNEISFTKTDTLTMIKIYQSNTTFGKFLKSYGDALMQNKQLSMCEIKTLIDEQIYIDSATKDVIANMFAELGNIGYIEQLERLSYLINYFDAIERNGEDKANKMMPFYKKMGFLIGLLVCIILI